MRRQKRSARAQWIAETLLAIGLWVAMIYILLAAPGLLVDDASTVPISAAAARIGR